MEIYHAFSVVLVPHIVEGMLPKSRTVKKYPSLIVETQQERTDKLDTI